MKHSSSRRTNCRVGRRADAIRVDDVAYVTHADLLRMAQRHRCYGIHTEPFLPLCQPVENFWVFKATVYKSAKCRGFVGYGDAHPGNVSPLVFDHAELRMAETRAVNRALRKAYGIALCSVEELPPWAYQHDRSWISTARFSPGRFFGKEPIMRMKIRGLNQPDERKAVLEGPYLARVVRFEVAGHAANPCRSVTFLILDPGPYSGRYVRTRLYCHERALWKLRWFLRDFGYDQGLLTAEELDDRQVIGLEGVIRLAFWGTNGRRRLDVQGFAPKEEWVELSQRMGAERPEAAHAEA